MPTLYIMCGQAFSGKSTLAKDIARYTNANLVSQDSIWFEKEEEAKLSGQKPDYHVVLEISKQKIREALKDAKSVVFDNTNASFHHREEFRQIANEYEAKAVVVYLNTNENELKKRQEFNKITMVRHDVKEEEIQKVRDRFEVPTYDENVLMFKPEDSLELFLEKV